MGIIVHRESKTFPKQKIAKDWGLRREIELQEKTVYKQKDSIQIGELIRQYLQEYQPEGKTKSSDLNRLMNSDIGKMNVHALTSGNLISYIKVRNKTALPQTANNDLVWLKTTLKTMRAALGLDYDLSAFDDAREVLRREGLIAKSQERDRRPTREELIKLSRYFYDFDSSIPMLHIMWFAIYSARRLSEITRLEWADNNPDRLTGLVRDAKHPRNKKGNHKRFKYTRSGWKIVCKQKPNKVYIFPYNERSISANFTRACKILGIDDLHFHDLRHEAASRLFEAGYPIEQVQLFTLHESWKTLARYTHLKPEEISLK